MRKTITELARQEKPQQLIRLAPYARVSSDSEDQRYLHGKAGRFQTADTGL